MSRSIQGFANLQWEPSPNPCRQITKITSATGEPKPTDSESRLIEPPTIASLNT
jgi:hypothetical protein